MSLEKVGHALHGLASDMALSRNLGDGRRPVLDAVRWSDFDRGGHFAAMEAPDLLVEDVRAFFRSLR